jgi:ATP-binding cassette subfamily C (CFTR/MRP) protein 1
VRTPTALTAAALVVIDAIGLLLLSHHEHFRSLRPSSIINAYLLVTVLFDIARTRSLWIQHAPKPISIVFSAMLAAKLIVACAEALEKRNILLSQFQDTSLEATSGIYGRAFFWWLNKTMSTGFRSVLRKGDMFPIEKGISSAVLKTKAEKLWSEANKERPQALFWSTLNANRSKLLLGIFPRICLFGFSYAQPLLLLRTVNFISSSQESDDIGLGLVGAFLVVFLGRAITKAIYSHMCYRFITAVRGTLISLIYAKTVHLSITALDESAAITLMSNDTGKCPQNSVCLVPVELIALNFPNIEGICRGFENLHEFWAVPIELGIALFLLQRQLGLSFLAPAAVAIISTASTVLISQYIGNAQRIWNKAIQTRVNVSASMLGAMKVRETTFPVSDSRAVLTIINRPSKCSVLPPKLQKFSINFG